MFIKYRYMHVFEPHFGHIGICICLKPILAIDYHLSVGHLLGLLMTDNMTRIMTSSMNGIMKDTLSDYP